jgi:DNA-nicking Smr family endonuclease
MNKAKKHINSKDFKNPFITEDREELWKKLEKGAKPISKSELMKRAEEAKNHFRKNNK